jgi:hypothetical protein
MNRMTTLIGCAVILAAELLLGTPTSSQAAANTTNVCGTISTSTTWTVISSPYEVCFNGATVGPTATLTIQPGVTVQFQQGVNSRLNVQGALTAIGTVSQPITFTGVVTTPGSWSGLFADNTVITPALVQLNDVTIEDGGAGSAHAQLYADRAVVTLTHGLVRDGIGSGLHFAYREAGFDVESSSFISNSLDAMQLDTPATDIVLSDLHANSNGTNAVYLYAQGMNIAGQRHWANPGIPYLINYIPANHSGDELTIDPGSELQFMPNSGLNIGGQLKAIGLPDQPITFTAQTQTPGGWRGLIIDGGNTTAVAQLDYATVEYGGGNLNAANIMISDGGLGQLIARHTTIRYSAEDGLRFNGNGFGSILNSQIISNSQVVTTAYGINSSGLVYNVLASNDWWGDPNGPKSDVPGCSPGQGSRVSNEVIFNPVLTTTNLNAEFPLTAQPQVTLAPRRWFAPADNVSKVYFDITVRDGNGLPLVGRATHLHTTPGTAIHDGGLTDPTGHALAYITSNVAGDVNVSVALDPVLACEGTLPPSAKVTFTPPIVITDLFPDAPAPYVNNDLSLTPLPTTVGVTSTIHAKLTNPLTVPITVDVEFAFVQSSVGLAFGPIKEITQTIPASTTISLSADFVPAVTGHYCVQVSYSILAIGPQRPSRPLGDKKSGQLNTDSKSGPSITPNGKETLDRADKSWKLVEKMAPNGTQVQTGILDAWWGWAKDTTKWASHELGFDPPRQDYTVATVPVWHRWPHIQPGVNMSAARANAHNAVSDALADVAAYGTAAATAFDRYSGASAANDLTWSSQQVNAQMYYQQQMGTALMTYADALDAFRQVLIDEGETNLDVTVADVTAYQQRLATTGFTPDEITAAHLVGLTDDDIEAYRQETIAADPTGIAGNLLDIYANEAFVSRNLGDAMLHPYAFSPGGSVSGGAGLLKPSSVLTTTIGNTLVQIGNTSSTIQVGNPLSVTSEIDLSVRRIDLPADWAVAVSPAQVTLAPNEVTTVTVNILTGSPVPQGTMPRVAVEGYVGSQLLGGVAVDVVVPNYMPYFLHVYLPLIRR